MITRIFGKVVEYVYSVNCNQKEILDKDGSVKIVYSGKPEIFKTSNVKEWEELCFYKGAPRYNYNVMSCMGYKYLNISETEEVKITKEIFRADLNECHLHSNKIVKEIETGKEEAEEIYEGHVKKFNKAMIESNERLAAYCNLHKLSYENTDCIELFKLVFPDDGYIIEDGVMRVKEKYSSVIRNSSGITTIAADGCISVKNSCAITSLVI